MKISGRSLDDILLDLYTRLLNSRNRELYTVESSTKGPNREVIGATLVLTNPLARLSRSSGRGRIFSALGEFIWYMSGTNKLNQIEHYIPEYCNSSDDNNTVYGAYGPRLVGKGRKNQLKTILKLLDKKPETRQAVIQIFDSKDILEPHKDVPCTCTIQFLVRDNRVNVVTHMRSNDIFLGLPHDVFCFTMLQELIARELGYKVGKYVHLANSLHFYERDREKIYKYIDEGYQSNKPMPAMPTTNPLGELNNLINIEKLLREGGNPDTLQPPTLDYWKDLSTLLQIFNHTKRNAKLCNIEEYRTLEDKLINKDYFVYTTNRLNKMTQGQLDLSK